MSDDIEICLSTILASKNFQDSWEGMMDQKVLEHVSLQQVCATFYMLGFKDCMLHAREKND